MTRAKNVFDESNTLLVGLIFFFLVTVAASCSSFSKLNAKRASLSDLDSIERIVSVSFGPDGKLWRARPTSSFVVVDFSEDFGKSFSKPVAVNASAKRIQASHEDRPSIVVDHQGRIYVLFKADDIIPRSAFLSVSKDGGRHFSEPVLVSDKADQSKHYQGVVAINKDYSQAYVFWSDERNRHKGKDNALYYAAIEIAESIKTPNILLKESICECCRLAVDFDVRNNPVVLARTLYNRTIRDHGLFVRQTGNVWAEQRATYDNWHINACPEHGPALSIGPNGRYHLVWFTQGDKRQGLFYAFSDDKGARLSNPRPIGNPMQLPGHADVLSIGNQVALVWQEFDGEKTIIKASVSVDRGQSWSAEHIIGQSAELADYAFLIANDDKIYVSWNSENTGYSLIPVNLGK